MFETRSLEQAECKYINKAWHSPIDDNRDFSQIAAGEKAMGHTGFDSDANRSIVDNSKLFAGRPSVRLNAKKGTGGFGGWGGICTLTRPAKRFETLYTQAYMNFPSDFSFLCRDNGNLKFIRYGFERADGSKAPYSDIYIHNSLNDPNDTNEFGFMQEDHQRWKWFGDKRDPNKSIVKEEWAGFQFGITLDTVPEADGGKASVKFWKDKELLVHIKDRATMGFEDDIVKWLYLFTYWNGLVPQDQHCWLGNLRISNTPDAQDEHGNPMLRTLSWK